MTDVELYQNILEPFCTKIHSDTIRLTDQSRYSICLLYGQGFHTYSTQQKQQKANFDFTPQMGYEQICLRGLQIVLRMLLKIGNDLVLKNFIQIRPISYYCPFVCIYSLTTTPYIIIIRNVTSESFRNAFVQINQKKLMLRSLF